MARSFRCDTDEAEKVATGLTHIESNVRSRRSSGRHLDPTGSPLIDYALREFVAAAVQAETDLARTLARTATLFRALARGTVDLDRMFAGRRQ